MARAREAVDAALLREVDRAALEIVAGPVQTRLRSLQATCANGKKTLEIIASKVIGAALRTACCTPSLSRLRACLSWLLCAPSGCLPACRLILPTADLNHGFQHCGQSFVKPVYVS